MAIRVRVRIEGIREILAAFDRMPADIQNVVRDRSLELAEELALRVRTAGVGRGRQAALAASTVVAKRDRVPVITAGARGPHRARAVVFGTEFGATRKFGWYAQGRYFHSPAKQYPTHLGAGSYWFFRTVENSEARISQAYLRMADEIIHRWAA